MPIKIPNKLPAAKVLAEENIFVMDEKRASTQDIRPLRIGILNLMPTKIATELGWYPETTFKEGIEKTILWYLDNQEWVKSVTSGDYQKYYEEMYTKR